MLPTALKNTLIFSGIAFVIGLYSGYSFSNTKADIDRLKLNETALHSEVSNLQKQLEVEHDRQKAATEAAAKTQEDLADLESRYSAAIDELNNLQLQYIETDNSDEATLSADSSIASTNQKSQCRCGSKDNAKFQRLYEEQLIIAKDCDINAIYLNQLIDLYNSL